MEQPEFLYEFLTGPFGRLAAGIWGAVWGSFFNVLIIRLPQQESLIRPVSSCRSCKQPIAWFDNIPLLSFILLRGRCRHCGARFSIRYLVVELLVCGLSLLMHQLYVVQGTGALGLRMAQLVITSLFCGTLVALTFIDLDTFRIPDAVTYPGIVVCMVLSVFMGHAHLWDGLVGGVAGYLLIRIIADGYQLVTGRMGMGYGDAKLLAMIGGLLGWQVILPALVLSSFQGSLIGITALVILRRRQGRGGQQHEIQGESREVEQPLRHARIPFGPFLSLAAIELMLIRDWLPVLFPFAA